MKITDSKWHDLFSISQIELLQSPADKSDLPPIELENQTGKQLYKSTLCGRHFNLSRRCHLPCRSTKLRIYVPEIPLKGAYSE
ncbi:hypothetical protein CEXT_211311 [Caerostris extrusa]|uniref:Uncharacterized protein n=1 Tax=Caerostris extrusa TaxID=172846 RepID=A0AAV4XBC8_CAEEX|nr:hypothetical protein CEXT_211311 [Caerostris extrusa]